MWNIDYGKRGTRRGHLSLKTLCVRNHYLLLYVDMSTQIDVNIHSMVAKTGRAGVPNAYRSLRLAVYGELRVTVFAVVNPGS